MYVNISETISESSLGYYQHEAWGMVGFQKNLIIVFNTILIFTKSIYT